MAKVSLRTASILCVAACAAIWLFFMGLRFSSFDIRVIPGVGPFMLLALATALLTPFAATGLAIAALIRQPKDGRNWLTLGCAIAALCGQWVVFTVTRWM
jgi:hypothetical protein